MPGELIVFETSDETNDPVKINKALDEILRKSERNQQEAIGLIPRIDSVITTDSNIGVGRLSLEANDDNKNLVISIDGKNYSVALTEV